MRTSAYNSGAFERARRVAEQLEGQHGPEAHVPVILMAMRDRNAAKARAAFEKLLAYDPSYAMDPEPSLRKIGLFPGVAKPLVEALRAAQRDLGL